MMTVDVAIVGGGVAGLTAAHELVTRGLTVTVYERGGACGGKARSVLLAGTGRDGRQDLPGEHGFRHFPWFYSNLRDTLGRIPTGSGESVLDRLQPAPALHYAHPVRRHLHVPGRFPGDLPAVVATLRAAVRSLDGISPLESHHFASRMACFLTSCEARRHQDYEELSWWDFIGAETRSDAYCQTLARGMTLMLAAMKARQSSTRTVGRILVQLLLSIALPGAPASTWVLDGPTSERWVEPWRRWLEGRGVRFHTDTAVTSLLVEGDGVVGIRCAGPGGTRRQRTDAVVLAVPLDVAQALATPELVAVAPSLAGLRHLETRWMNGLQLYLRRPVPLPVGHSLYLDSPWALSSIAQAAPWKAVDLLARGDGRVREVLSVEVCDWGSPGRYCGKPARACTAAEVVEEVWAEIRLHLEQEAGLRLAPDDLVHHALDPGLSRTPEGTWHNPEPMFVNLVGSWPHRPGVRVAPGLFLAADYVRTNADLACMESANEAARRAANAVLGHLAADRPPVPVHTLQEPAWLEPLKAIDERRHARGLAHLMG